MNCTMHIVHLSALANRLFDRNNLSPPHTQRRVGPISISCHPGGLCVKRTRNARHRISRCGIPTCPPPIIGEVKADSSRSSGSTHPRLPRRPRRSTTRMGLGLCALGDPPPRRDRPVLLVPASAAVQCQPHFRSCCPNLSWRSYLGGIRRSRWVADGRRSRFVNVQYSAIDLGVIRRFG